MSGSNAPELSVTPFCLHLAGWDFGSAGEAVSTGVAPVSLPGARGASLRFADPWVTVDRLDRAVLPNMNTPLVAVSGIVGAMGGAKEKAG